MIYFQRDMKRDICMRGLLFLLQGMWTICHRGLLNKKIHEGNGDFSFLTLPPKHNTDWDLSFQTSLGITSVWSLCDFTNDGWNVTFIVYGFSILSSSSFHLFQPCILWWGITVPYWFGQISLFFIPLSFCVTFPHAPSSHFNFTLVNISRPVKEGALQLAFALRCCSQTRCADHFSVCNTPYGRNVVPYHAQLRFSKNRFECFQTTGGWSLLLFK